MHLQKQTLNSTKQVPRGRAAGKTIVVALGGNAILRPGEKGTFDEQMANIRNTAAQLARLIGEGNRLIITHGNGPQVGRIFQQQELGVRAGLPEMPLYICGAMSQAQIGAMIQQALHNELILTGCPKTVVTLICQTLVDPFSEAFRDPTKPIGSFYSEEEAKKAMAEKGETWKEDSGRGWRRVVPSPEPQGFPELDAIRLLIEQDVVVVVSGGGGTPASRDPRGILTGVEAVVEKDLAAQEVARIVGADTLLILTDVTHAMINYRTPREQAIKEISLEKIKEYHRRGHFIPGSMGPKVLAAIRFIENGGKRAVITSLANALAGAEGKVGTVVAP